jgi:hypothetical protein
MATDGLQAPIGCDEGTIPETLYADGTDCYRAPELRDEVRDEQG